MLTENSILVCVSSSTLWVGRITKNGDGYFIHWNNKKLSEADKVSISLEEIENNFNDSISNYFKQSAILETEKELLAFTLKANLR